MEFDVGSILDGKVTGITKFGAFVALPGGKSGLVHISEIAHSYVSDVKDFLAEGQDVKVKVISIDESNRINLSIKKAIDPPPRPAGPGRGSFRPNNNGGGRPNNNTNSSSRDNRSSEGGAPSRPYNSRPSGGRSGGYASRNAAPKEPANFEDRLKQFMQDSDSRQSDLNRTTDKRGNRRGNGRNRG